MHSFFYDNLPEAGDAVRLTEREAKHLFRTLRARGGEEVKLLDGRGKTARCRVTEDKLLQVIELFNYSEPATKLHLFVAPPRRQQMNVMLKQAAELGIWTITPILTEYCVGHRREASPERWQTVMMEGCKQSGNPFLPQLRPWQALPDALQTAQQYNCMSFFGEVPQFQSTDPEPPVPRQTADIAWFVGPEGGFSEEERQLLSAVARPFSCGRWILRVETAAICGAAMLLQNLTTN